MINLFKSGTTPSNGTIVRNNFVIAVQEGIGYGPTASTGFWAGITPPLSGYTIYTNKSANGPSIFTSTNNENVIITAQKLGGTNINTINDALIWFNGQSDRLVTNIDYPSIVTSGMVLNLDAGYVPSYPRTGTTWNDLSGNNYGSVLVGTCLYSGGTSGTTNPDRLETNCVSITSTGYVQTNSIITFTDASPFSLDFWVKLRNGTPATDNCLVGNGTTGSYWMITTQDTTGDSWNIRFRNINFVYSAFTRVTNYNIQNNWGNICITIDTNRNANFYLNGTFRESISLSSTTTNVRRIGGGYQSGLNQYNLQGALGTAKIYNRTLSETEVLQNYNALKPRFGL